MAVTLRMTLDGTENANAKREFISRIEGVLTYDEPLDLEEGADYLEVVLPDAVPEEEVRALVATMANLIGRPGSGFIKPMVLTPQDAAGSEQREPSA